MGATIPAAEDWNLDCSKWKFFKTPVFHLASGLTKRESAEAESSAHLLCLCSWSMDLSFFSVPQAGRWQSLEVHVVRIKGNAKKAIILHVYVVSTVLEDSCGEKHCKLPVKGWKWLLFSLHVRNEHKGQKMPVTEIRKNSKQFQ